MAGTAWSTGCTAAASIGDSDYVVGYQGVTNYRYTGLQAKQYVLTNTIITKTADYTLAAVDYTKVVEMNVAGANNLTVPLNATISLPVGSLIPAVQYGAGTTTIVAAGGVTIRSSSGVLTSPGQYSPMFLLKRATDEWYLWNGTASYTASNGMALTANNFTWGGALTADTSITGSFNVTFSNKTYSFTTTYTALANNSAAFTRTGTITARATASDTLNGDVESYTLVSAAATQTLTGKLLNVTFTDSNSATQYIQRWQNAGTDRLTMAGSGILTHAPSSATLGSATRLNVFSTTSNTSAAVTNVAYQFKVTPTVISGSSPSLVWSIMGSHQAANGNMGFAWDLSSTNYLFLYNSSATNGISGPYISATTSQINFNSGIYQFVVANSTGSNVIIAGGSAATSATPYLNLSHTGTYAAASGGPVVRIMSSTPVINYTVAVASATFVGGLYYSPTESSLTGTSHYFIVSGSSTALSGFGTLTPANAFVVIAAGTTTVSPLKFTSGTNLTSAITGCWEYDGTNLTFTRTGTTREYVLTGIANSVSPTSPNRTITVVVAGVTLYIAAKTTND